MFLNIFPFTVCPVVSYKFEKSKISQKQSNILRSIWGCFYNFFLILSNWDVNTWEPNRASYRPTLKNKIFFEDIPENIWFLNKRPKCEKSAQQFTKHQQRVFKTEQLTQSWVTGHQIWLTLWHLAKVESRPAILKVILAA